MLTSAIRAEDYVNIEADLNYINLFIEDHQQAEDQDQELESEEEESPITESSVKMYSNALKHLKDLENFALTRSDSNMFETISRARVMTENCAYKSTSYIPKTLFNYRKKLFQ
jgi:cell shape-determining protein MreC